MRMIARVINISMDSSLVLDSLALDLFMRLKRDRYMSLCLAGGVLDRVTHVFDIVPEAVDGAAA